MSWVKNNILGGNAAKAANKAADVQAQSGREAIQIQRETIDKIRSDLAPFRQVGIDVISPLTELSRQVPTIDTKPLQTIVQSPESVMQSPFYKALADEAQQRVFSNAAARGKLGSGGTASALQNELVKLGSDLAARETQRIGSGLAQQLELERSPQQQAFNQLFDLYRTGQAAASQQAQQQAASGAQIADLTTQIGNAMGAGQIGSAAAKSNAIGGLMNLGGSLGTAAILASDANVKDNIMYIGDENGVPLYEFTYNNDEDNTLHLGTIAQLVEDDYVDAVKMIDGVKHVDYSKLPLSETTLDIIKKTGKK